MATVPNDKTSGEVLNATEINTLRDAGFVVDLNAGATINGATLPVPVYQLASDGELYACDGADINTIKFRGLAISNSTDGNPIAVQHKGIVSGFSGLTIGAKYYAAKTGSSATDTTLGTASGSDNNVGNVAGTVYQRAKVFTPSTVGFLKKVQLKVKKSGSPTGNLVVEIVRGANPDVNNGDDARYGGGAPVAKATLAAASTTTSYVTYDFDLNVRLDAATYYVLVYHDTESSNNYFKIESDGTNDTATWQWDSSSTDWNSNSGNFYVSLDYDGATFTAGELTRYFYDYPIYIGTAISATQIYIEDELPRYAQGQTTRTSGSGRGRLTITHNLGVIPKLIKIIATTEDHSANSCNSISYGAATRPESQSCTNFRQGANPIEAIQNSSLIIQLANSTGDYNLYGVGANVGLFTETTFTINFITIGLSGTAYIQWEAFG